MESILRHADQGLTADLRLSSAFFVPNGRSNRLVSRGQDHGDISGVETISVWSEMLILEYRSMSGSMGSAHV